ETGHARAKKLAEKGNPDVKITKIDVDSIEVQIAIVKGKRAQVKNGMEKALAALREAMGVRHDYPLEIAAVDLPQAVYEKKVFYEVKEIDDKGKETGKMVKKERTEYHQLYKLDKDALVAAA